MRSAHSCTSSKLPSASLSRMRTPPDSLRGTTVRVRLPPQPARWPAAGWHNLCSPTAGRSWLRPNLLAGYALAGLALAVSFQTLSAAMEVVRTTGSPKRVLGLHKSRSVVLKLSGLFALYAFAGGQIMQSMFALWLRLRFRVNTGVIGSIFWRKHSHRNFRPAGRKHSGVLWPH